MKLHTAEFRHQGVPPHHPSQAGMALLFSLLVLVALMLASVAMVRVINSGSQIAGNLAFQQDALMVSERAAQIAIGSLYQALDANQDALDQSITALGFYANAPANLDPTGNALEGNTARALIRWDATYCDSFATQSYATCTLTPSPNVVTVNGNSASYIVFRLCNTAGSLAYAEVNCTTASTAAAGASAALSGNECQGAMNYEKPGNCLQQSVESTLFYRIVVRTLGPRNTVSFTETLVYL